METLQVYSAGTPPAWGCRAAAPAAASPAANPRIVEDKENVLPAGTPLGGPQLPLFSASWGKKAHEAAPARRPLGDVTQHYESKGLCIGTMGGSFSAHAPSTCGQEAAAAMAAAAAAAAVAAAEAAQARRAAVKRQALRTMR